jgi:hypothetical protein
MTAVAAGDGPERKLLAARAPAGTQFFGAIEANKRSTLRTIGSGQCGAVFKDYQRLHSIPTIDLCEYYDYESPTTPMPGDEWNGLQAKMRMCAADGKPVRRRDRIKLSQAGGDLQTRASWLSAKLSAQFAQASSVSFSGDGRRPAATGSGRVIRPSPSARQLRVRLRSLGPRRRHCRVEGTSVNPLAASRA